MAVVSWKVVCQCLHAHGCRRIVWEPTALCDSQTFVLVSVDAALRLCGDSLLGPRRLRCPFIDCTAVNLPNISAASASTRGRRRTAPTGDLNVFVYWSPTPSNQFSTMWSQPARETRKAFIQMQQQLWFAFPIYFVACMLYTHDAKFNPPIFLPLNHSVL